MQFQFPTDHKILVFFQNYIIRPSPHNVIYHQVLNLRNLAKRRDHKIMTGFQLEVDAASFI